VCWRRVAKRLLDVAVATVTLLLLAPLIAVVAAAVRVFVGSPVIFRQMRPGLGERPFCILKFRTMRDAIGDNGRTLPDAERLTRLGSILRKLSLDEIPELVNVLRGDMSLVGPRPLLIRYLPYFTDRERARFSVRPGITGLAQISGRNEVSWSQRLAYDVEYVERWSLGLDVRILARTVAIVFTARGAVPDANSIMVDLDQERAHPAESHP